MKKIFRNSLLMLATGAFAVSCADYNETDNFKADPDPLVVDLYKDLKPVKEYIDHQNYPNMSLGATLNVKDFNDQTLAHAAAVTNFTDLYFGTSLMSGKIISEKGVMNYIDMKELLDHVEEIGGDVYGSALAANSGQADGWLNLLVSPIEIYVEFIELLTVDFSKVDTFEGEDAEIVKKDGQNVLKISSLSDVDIVDGFKIEPKAKYTTQFWVKSDKACTFSVIFSGTEIEGPIGGMYSIEGGGEWSRIAVEAQGAEGVEDGYLRIETGRGSTLYVKRVQVGYMPDNHRDQTPEEISDTIHWAMNAWCDGLMKNNAGRIQSFDLIEEPLATQTLDDGYHFDLKHSTDKIFWQDIFGSENYAPIVSKDAVNAYAKYGGNPDDLKFYIAETGLDNTQKYESLMYWIDIWTQKGAKIDGINAKLDLTYSEDAVTQAENEAKLKALFDNLVLSGKMIRLSNFDIKYQDAEGKNVTAKEITTEQRQKLADYYGHVIRKYMERIPHDKQAGICKGNMADTTDPVGIWTVDSKTKDWVRNATYKAFCDALSGE